MQRHQYQPPRCLFRLGWGFFIYQREGCQYKPASYTRAHPAPELDTQRLLSPRISEVSVSFPTCLDLAGRCFSASSGLTSLAQLLSKKEISRRVRGRRFVQSLFKEVSLSSSPGCFPDGRVTSIRGIEEKRRRLGCQRCHHECVWLGS